MIYWNKTWHTSLAQWSEDTCKIWEKRQLQVLRSLLKGYDDVSLMIFYPKIKCIDWIDPTSWQNLELLKRNLVHFISTMIWGYMPNLGTAQPTGHEFQKWLFLLVTFEIFFFVCVCVCSLGHVESIDTNFARIGWMLPVSHFEICCKLLYFFKCF